MAYTYSGTPAGLDTSLTAVQTHNLMKQPALLARYMRSILDEKFLGDYLLAGRYAAEGGAIAYPAGVGGLYPKDDPEVVGMGSQYPLTQMDAGQLALAKTLKRGLATHVWDEEISRMRMNAVSEATSTLQNGMIKAHDGLSLGVIASRVTATYASQAWTSAAGIVNGIMLAKAQLSNLKTGVTGTTLVLREDQYQRVMAVLLLAGLLPRETVNPINTGMWPQILGVEWVTSPNVPFADPLLVDREKLGGIATESIVSPEYSRAGDYELASERLQGRDGYELRIRRVAVPIVLRPDAGVRITGTGL